MPINFKEYTHDDLEEELRNFTEDLDKDFRDIYEQEIGSLKGSCRDLKKKFEQVVKAADDGSKKRLAGRSELKKPLSNGVCNDDNSDALADEEVESIMSTGQDGSDSPADTMKNGFGNLFSFERTRLRFKRLEQRSNARKQGGLS